jgi:hypothetical protein
MRSKYLPVLAVLCVGVAAGVTVTGCKPDGAVTPTEETRFKNPPKEIPPEALKIMREHSGGPPAGAASGKPADAPPPK